MNPVNAKYGAEPGLKACSHVSYQFDPFATQNIPARLNETSYILDGLLMNEIGRNVEERMPTLAVSQTMSLRSPYCCHAGSSRHSRFAVQAALSLRPDRCPKELRGLIGGKIREELIVENWPDILRGMAAGFMPPSQLLQKFTSYPRQHEMA